MVEWTDPDGHVAKTNSSGSGVALMPFIFKTLGQSQSHMTMWSAIQEQGVKIRPLRATIQPGFLSYQVDNTPPRKIRSQVKVFSIQ